MSSYDVPPASFSLNSNRGSGSGSFAGIQQQQQQQQPQQRNVQKQITAPLAPRPPPNGGAGGATGGDFAWTPVSTPRFQQQQQPSQQHQPAKWGGTQPQRQGSLQQPLPPSTAPAGSKRNYTNTASNNALVPSSGNTKIGVELNKFRSFGVYFEVKLRELLTQDVRDPNEERLSRVFSLFDELIDATPQLSEVLKLFRSEFLTSVYAVTMGPGGDAVRTPYFVTVQQLLREHENLIVELGEEAKETEMHNVRAEMDHLKAITTFQNNEIERLTKDTVTLREEVARLTSEIESVSKTGQQQLAAHEKQYSVLLKEVRELRVANVTWEREQRAHADLMKAYGSIRTTRMERFQQPLDFNEHDDSMLANVLLQLDTLETKLLSEYQSECMKNSLGETMSIRTKFVRNMQLLLEEGYNVEMTMK
eukprot:PhF_6_TR29416/c0_g1_i1/m.43475